MGKAGEKKHLRGNVLRLLRAMSPAQREADSAALRARLSPLLASSASRLGRPLCIALYAPLPHEVNLLPLLREHPQHRYAFPRCLPGRELAFHEVSSPSRELEAGAHGILAPRATLPRVAPDELDILLVPGVAFTPEGDRLGYGGGYYDRLIPRCPQAHVLSLAFSEQMVESLPTEAHDKRIPLIIQPATRGGSPSQEPHRTTQVPLSAEYPPPPPSPAT